MIRDLLDRMAGRGRRAFYGEAVSITDHMLQTAHAAELNGAPPALVAAALLHDVAYVVHDPLDDRALDAAHPAIGARFLAVHFGPAVAEPVRLHVAAKRYLCAIEPEYRAALSAASFRTLQAQGGPFSQAEAGGFQALPYAHDAVRLRRWDDAAKVAGARIPDLEHYRPLLEGLLRERRTP
jgi:gamma-butyrobetaine dioxygenase